MTDDIKAIRDALAGVNFYKKGGFSYRPDEFQIAANPARIARLLDALEQAQNAARESLIDAACFRFWVSEAARSPSAMARLIANCVTEDDYRRAIMPYVIQGGDAIAAMKGDA